MATLPRWGMEVVPTGEGPLIVRPSGDAGAAGVGQAAMGRSIQHLGSAITKKGMQAEQRTKQLQQDTQASQYALEATQGWNDLQTELAAETDPDARQPKWEGFQTAQRGRLGEIPDEDVRQRAQTWLNEQTAVWDTAVTTGTWNLRLKQSYDHLQALDTDATARRDDSLVVPHLSAMVNAGHMAGGDANDYLKAKRREIRGELGKDQIAAKVFQMEHGAALAALRDPKTFAGLDLDAQQVSAFRDGLHAQLDVQRAVASQEARAADQSRQRAGAQAIAAAYAGQLDVPTTIEAMASGAMAPDDARTAIELATKGPVEANDGETFMAAERLVSMVRNRQIGKDDALERLRPMAKKLTGATWQAKVQAIEKAGDPEDPLGRPGVRLFDSLIDEHYTNLGTFGDWGDPQAEQRYIDAKQRFAAWVAKNPEATDEQISTQFRSLVVPIAEPGKLERMGRFLWRMQPFARDYEWVRGDAEGGYELTTPELEPLTQQEFEDTVKSLPGGSKEQTEYYHRWIKKWR